EPMQLPKPGVHLGGCRALDQRENRVVDQARVVLAPPLVIAMRLQAPIASLGFRGNRRQLLRGTGFRVNRANACHQAAWSRSRDRKSTRLNSSHVKISYAVFCLKKKKIVGAVCSSVLGIKRDAHPSADTTP